MDECWKFLSEISIHLKENLSCVPASRDIVGNCIAIELIRIETELAIVFFIGMRKSSAFLLMTFAVTVGLKERKKPCFISYFSAIFSTRRNEISWPSTIFNP